MEEKTKQRVRIEQPGKESRQRRNGCLAAGAVLGILVGIMVALYGLPPILRAMYGEKVIDPGDERTVGGRTLSVSGFTVGRDELCLGIPGCPAESIQLSLRVTVEDPWSPDTDDFQIEIAGIDTWIGAIDPIDGVLETDLQFLPGETRTVILRFPLPLGFTAVETEPDSLHITTPRARLELSPELRR
ncbi:MAG TPA: hypothetical protein QGF35_04080 [Dehalococcoidia bacterium]|nr:hypothetical protein [Dehalococcoidia bacterium]